jgi:acetolactate synthase-1/3 small subunit
MTSPAASTVPTGTLPASTLPASTAPRHHIVTAVVENKAGVLARVASLFSRRGFNIFSLAVAPTDNERFSRITIVVDVESAPLEQIMKQLDKLINVVHITELAPEEAVEREMLLVTVGTGPGSARRDEVTALVESFDATIVDEATVDEGTVDEGTVDEGTGRMTVMLAGTPARIDEFENLVRPFGIVELQRTGLVALPKLHRVIGDHQGEAG